MAPVNAGGVYQDDVGWGVGEMRTELDVSIETMDSPKQ